MNNYQQNMNQYKSIALKARVETASPHELIEMLLQGARTHIATAIGNIQRNQVAEKGLHIGKAISVIEGLRTSLDHNNGGDVSENLDKLYEYIQQLLLKANLTNDQECLMESNKLLAEIHDAWQAINPGHSDLI